MILGDGRFLQLQTDLTTVLWVEASTDLVYGK
jgi:hypothetical protein